MIKPIYENSFVKLYQGDCLQIMPELNVKFDLIILDPPYFSTHIKQLNDNQWKTSKDYLKWIQTVLSVSTNLFKSSSSIYLFHNDIDIMTDILSFCKHDLNLKLRNHIKWNKFPTHNNFSRIIKTYGNNRNYSQTFSEDIYYMTVQSNSFSPQNPFSVVMLQMMKKLDLSQKDISGLCLSKNGKRTGWISNKLSGKQLPTREQWNKLCDFFHINNDYDSLYEKCLNERYRFNQPVKSFSCGVEKQKELLKPYSEIWEFEKDRINGFYTTKPVNMISNIINISSNENDYVLDPFSGSGTTGIACMETNRKCVLIEKESKYCDIIIKRLQDKEKEMAERLF